MFVQLELLFTLLSSSTFLRIFLFRCCISFRGFSPLKTSHDSVEFAVNAELMWGKCVKTITEGGDQWTVDTAVLMFCKKKSFYFYFGDTFPAKCSLPWCCCATPRYNLSVKLWTTVNPFLCLVSHDGNVFFLSQDMKHDVHLLLFLLHTANRGAFLELD